MVVAPDSNAMTAYFPCHISAQPHHTSWALVCYANKVYPLEIQYILWLTVTVCFLSCRQRAKPITHDQFLKHKFGKFRWVDWSYIYELQWTDVLLHILSVCSPIFEKIYEFKMRKSILWCTSQVTWCSVLSTSSGTRGQLVGTVLYFRAKNIFLANQQDEFKDFWNWFGKSKFPGALLPFK